MAVIRSILPVVSYSVAFDAGAAMVADAAPPPIGRASIPDRLASESIQELPRDDDVLAGRQAGKDLGLAACLAADADLGG